MTVYRVHMQAFIDVSVDVEADDYEAAIEKAYEDMPSSVCAQCSGWGQNWSRDEGEYEPYEVVNDETGETEWRERGDWQRVIAPDTTPEAAGGAS